MSKKHEWQTVTIYREDGYYESVGSAATQELPQALVGAEALGWEVFSVFGQAGSIVVVCRRPFVPAVMRTESE
jgi:hypothetical protein